MKTGIKTIEETDYDEIKDEVEQLQWLTREFRIQTPTARIDSTDTLGHRHRMWEWGRVLKNVKDMGYTAKGTNVLDIGTAYSLIGPALAYLGCNVVETDIDEPAYKAERLKIKRFLDQLDGAGTFNWVLAGFGSLQERVTDGPNLCKQYDVVLSISTIEHVAPELEKTAWKEMADLLKPDGLLIVTMDCFEISKKGYQYDDVRWTNYDLAMVKTRVDELKSYGLVPVGEEDYTWHGVQVADGSFSCVHMVKE